MEVSVEKQEGIGRKLTITVPAKEFDQHVATELKKFKGTAKIPGFRKGKVPAKILEQQFGGQAARNAVDALINVNYPKALEKEKLVPASLLNINPTQVEKEKPFIFEVDIEVYPEVTKPSLEGVELTQATVEVTKADIDKTLLSIQERQVTYAAADKKAAKGDQVLVDFSGTIDGELFEGGQMQDAEIVLGAGQFLPEFEKGVTGAKKGDTPTAIVSFPDDYQGQAVAGKTAEFAITVKEVRKGTLPELSDDFALAMGVEGGLKGMREEVEKGLQRELDQKMRTKVRTDVMDALAQGEDFPLPQAMVREEIDRSMEQVTKQLEQQGMGANVEQFVKRENFEEESKKRVKLGLMVREIIESEKIELDEDLLKERVTQMAGSYADPDAYAQHVLNDETQRNQMAGVVLEEQVVSKLLETAKIKKVKQSYEEFMHAEQQS